MEWPTDLIERAEMEFRIFGRPAVDTSRALMQEVIELRAHIVALRADAERTYSDAELTEIYRKANGRELGKAIPLSSAGIFKAMRAMRK